MLLLILSACLCGGKSDTADTGARPVDSACIEWCPVAAVEGGAECLVTLDCAPVCLPPGQVPDMTVCLYMIVP